MKALIYSLLFVFTLVSCSKKDDPAPDSGIESKWKLATADISIKSIFGDEENNLDFNQQDVYLDLKADNKFSSNIVVASDIAELVEKGYAYESEYQMDENTITLQMYDGVYESYVPVKFQIKSRTDSELVLVMTKAELAETMKAYDELDDTNENSLLLGFITSLNAVLTLTK